MHDAAEVYARQAEARARREEKRFGPNPTCSVHVAGRPGPTICLWHDSTGRGHALCRDCYEDWQEAGQPALLKWLNTPPSGCRVPDHVEALIVWELVAGEDPRWELLSV